jgi:hypothetical protein
MDTLTLFGLLSVGSMLFCYAMEDRSAWFVLVFALACWSSAVYAWLGGTWPFTVVESVWGIVALRRYFARVQAGRGTAVHP